MERLTYWQDGTAMMKKRGGWASGGISILAAYEDTGLTPEEIKELQKREKIFYDVAKRYTDLGEYYHLLELASAEQDGRLVVLEKGERNGQRN